MDRNFEYWILQCYVKNPFNTHSRNEEITAVDSYISREQYKDKYSDYFKIENVDFLRFNMKDMRYFPKGINKFFPNLTAFAIERSMLKEIKQDNLKALPKIVFLDLSVNMIEIIQKDLFKFNPLLQNIDLNNNMIKEIDGNVFDDLHFLKNLNLLTNICVLMEAGTKQSMEKLINEVKVNCGKRSQKFILDEKKGTKFNWRKYFWMILIFGTSSVVFLVYGIFKIFMTVKVSPEN
jgi:hypothetical protein